MADTKIDRETAIQIAQKKIQVLTDSKLSDLFPGDKYIDPVPGTTQDRFTSARLQKLQSELERNDGSTPKPRFHDEAIGYAEAMLRLRVQLPPWLADFVADVLRGDRKRPKGPGERNEHQRRQDIAIFCAAKTLVNKYNLPRYSNNSEEPENYLTAFQAVAEAAYRQGINRTVSEEAVKRIWNHMTVKT